MGVCVCACVCVRVCVHVHVFEPAHSYIVYNIDQEIFTIKITEKKFCKLNTWMYVSIYALVYMSVVLLATPLLSSGHEIFHVHLPLLSLE